MPDFVDSPSEPLRVGKSGWEVGLGVAGENYDWNVKMKFKNLILLNSLDSALKSKNLTTYIFSKSVIVF